MDDDLSPAILAIDQDELSPIPQLDLSHLPPIYVLTAHLSIEEQHEAEDALSSRGAVRPLQRLIFPVHAGRESQYHVFRFP